MKIIINSHAGYEKPLNLLFNSMIDAGFTDFADEVIEEMASFPFGDYDDFCDSATMALMRFRQGGFISLNEDYQDEVRLLKKNRTVYY